MVQGNPKCSTVFGIRDQDCWRSTAGQGWRTSGPARPPKRSGGELPTKDFSCSGIIRLNTDLLAQAKEHLKPDATAVYVAAHQAAGAIEEALEAEIPLIVAVAEHIPLHDMLRVASPLK